MLIWYLHYIYKSYVLLFLRQFTYDKKAIAIKKNVKKNIYVYDLSNACATLILLWTLFRTLTTTITKR